MRWILFLSTWALCASPAYAKTKECREFEELIEMRGSELFEDMFRGANRKSCTGTFALVPSTKAWFLMTAVEDAFSLFNKFKITKDNAEKIALINAIDLLSNRVTEGDYIGPYCAETLKTSYYGALLVYSGAKGLIKLNDKNKCKNSYLKILTGSLDLLKEGRYLVKFLTEEKAKLRESN